MKKVAIVSPLEQLERVPARDILCYVDSNITVEDEQLVECTYMTDEKHRVLLGICLSTGLMDEKLIKSGWRVRHYISAVYHKELTGSNSEDFI